jgi:hypothetical protein
MLKTLAEAKESQILDIVGACSGSTKFLSKMNASTERLMNRGDWVGTVQPINVCVRSGWIVWPRYAGKIRAINNCCGPMPNIDIGWNFMEKPIYESYCGGRMSLTQWGKSATYNDISPGNRLVRAYIDANADVGKTVKIFGIDHSTGQALRTLNTDGSYSDGITLTLAKPYASSAVYVRSISRVIKERTEGKVWLGEYDPVTNLMKDLAYYEPSETNPDYTKTWLVGCCSTIKSVVALVKLKFIPVIHDTDLVLIQNLHALKLMMQAADFETANNRDLARQYEADAIRELNVELEDETPDSQIPVVVNVFGGTSIGQQHVY